MKQRNVQRYTQIYINETIKLNDLYNYYYSPFVSHVLNVLYYTAIKCAKSILKICIFYLRNYYQIPCSLISSKIPIMAFIAAMAAKKFFFVRNGPILYA